MVNPIAKLEQTVDIVGIHFMGNTLNSNFELHVAAVWIIVVGGRNYFRKRTKYE